MRQQIDGYIVANVCVESNYVQLCNDKALGLQTSDNNKNHKNKKSQLFGTHLGSKTTRKFS